MPSVENIEQAKELLIQTTGILDRLPGIARIELDNNTQISIDEAGAKIRRALNLLASN